ncbi:MAG: fibronectin/fibrinogen-binding protein [Ruminococcaceae bacterium]|nr:fibronectin/fibrinogen-binding protein [Oscillospiraceae bacterium]
MAFDAGMLACVVHEIKSVARGGRIEKIYQPERDEIILQMRTTCGGKRLLINAGSNCPRISFTSVQKENPMQAPMFCMLLRKHLTGASLSEIEQLGFERVVKLTFDTRDEMGFECKKYLIAEVMGKYSNLIFADEKLKVISALKTIDFTTSSLRQVLPGMTYELPPAQNKLDPTKTNFDEFSAAFGSFPAEKGADKFITSAYLGISTSVAREIVHRTCGRFDAATREVGCENLYSSFALIFAAMSRGEFAPTVILENNAPIEYAFVDLGYYGSGFEHRAFESASEALDLYFASRDREQRVRQRAADILGLLTNAESRLIKKIDVQEKELADCAKGEKYKQYGDLITANIYKLKRGDKSVELTDYESWNDEKQDFDTLLIELDERLSPAANAQRYYKLYNKSKTAKIELAKQLDIARSELEYVYSVFDALTKAETTADLAEIRDELYRSGYASKMKGYTSPKKHPAPVIAEFVTTNGYRVLCGKNNYQNEYITHKLAERHDYWFHAKNMAGSHVLLITNGEEPPAEDFTDACEIAAYYSKAKGTAGVEVDYLFARGVKKVSGAKPGFVIYHNNWSAFVTPDEEKIKRMRKK